MSARSATLGHLHRLAILLCCLRLAAAAATIRTQEARQYILPILSYGPHNEKRDLRHILALAKQLDMGVMLTGIFKHYLDNEEADRARRHRQMHGNTSNTTSLPPCFPAAYKGFMPLTQVVDRAPIDAWVPTATVEQLKSSGWDGKLDALVYPEERAGNMGGYIDRTCIVSNLTLPDSAPRYAMPKALQCNQGRIKELQNKLKGRRYIGMVMVLLGWQERGDLRTEPTQPPTDACRRTMYQADRLLRPSAWITGIADRYIQQHLLAPAQTQKSSNASAGYLAVHVRPYPDECLELWKDGKLATLSRDVLKQNCGGHLYNLHERLGGHVSKAMQTAGVRTVFVLTHPAIRHTVDALLQQAGIRGAHYLEPAHLTNLTNCQDTSATFMLMVEEAIAVKAPYYLGTHTSSITHNIVYERLSSGRQHNEFLEFGPR